MKNKPINYELIGCIEHSIMSSYKKMLRFDKPIKYRCKMQASS